MRDRRITKPCFRTCSTCRSRSQAPFCLYTLRLISKQPEGTFGRLRYSLGGDRPSQTTHRTMSPNRIHGSGLELQNHKGGISLLAPRRLTPSLQSLPPMLHMQHRSSLPGCSKGARGLSVLLRVTGIFTGATDSLSRSPRQRPNRYAIRAGRNFTSVRGFSRRRLYLHLIAERAENLAAGVLPLAVGQGPGPACYGATAPSRGLTP